ncbi:MAG: hypothetical protein GQ531_10505 [Sulfurovum sp.]|nr:hypothetical protein [Sulfurovum sp.]
MNNKFENIPVEADTKILMSSPMKWGELDIVYQKWTWEGIKVESIVFLNDDVKEMDDEALEADIRESSIVEEGSQMSIKRGDEFTFVNFNFVS